MESNEVNVSFFPPPPPRHKSFTNRNLKLARRLMKILDRRQTEGAPEEIDSFDPKSQFKLLSDSNDTNQPTESIEGLEGFDRDLDLRTLVRPPRLDWIRERGGWTAFGDWEPWPEKSSRASLEGMPKLYDEKMERKSALQALLNTMIYSYLQLLDVLGNQGPTSMSAVNELGQAPVRSNTDRIVSHIELTAFNMHGLCNELRPRQARETLKLMIREQTREKKEKAKMVRRTCEELRDQLARLKSNDHQGIQGSMDHSESKRSLISTQDRNQNDSSNHELDDRQRPTNSNQQAYDYDQLMEIARSIFLDKNTPLNPIEPA